MWDYSVKYCIFRLILALDQLPRLEALLGGYGNPGNFSVYNKSLPLVTVMMFPMYFEKILSIIRLCLQLDFFNDFPDDDLELYYVNPL